jgi:hypothetical protein
MRRLVDGHGREQIGRTERGHEILAERDRQRLAVGGGAVEQRNRARAVAGDDVSDRRGDFVNRAVCADRGEATLMQMKPSEIGFSTSRPCARMRSSSTSNTVPQFAVQLRQ